MSIIYAFSVINFSDDLVQGPDSNNENTKASLALPDMSGSFTICGDYLTEAWIKDYTAAMLFQLRGEKEYGAVWAFLMLNAGLEDTQISGSFGKVQFSAMVPKIWFHLTWIHVCVSLDSESGRAVLVVDSQLLVEKVYQEALEGNNVALPENVHIDLGFYSGMNLEYVGMVTNINIFSSPLPTARMVGMTKAGSDECGAPGDLLSWEEADWQLQSMARLQMVGVKDNFYPCRRESSATVFPADFYYQVDCMNHCTKLGNGRSPPVRTAQEWDWLRKEVQAITPESTPEAIKFGLTTWLPVMWLAATDEREEEVWQDFYSPHERLQPNWTLPWYSSQHVYGDSRNCLLWMFNQMAERCWVETPCTGSGKVCPCQYQSQPILRLRGLCGGVNSRVDLRYTPKQLFSTPTDLMLVGSQKARITYNDKSKKWVLTSAGNSVRAEARAAKESYVLGRHQWTVTGDIDECHEGQQYKTSLKLTGCNPEGQFTCDDGQCVTMEQRCNQIPNCRDKSDEVDCKLIILEKNYNKNVPPIIPREGGEQFDPTAVNISITLLKIVNMEEVVHKIDFKFGIVLEWTENRVKYHNLKEKSSLNALSVEDIGQLWLPYVIYANTDKNEAVQLEQADSTKTTIVVTREGKFVRSTIYVSDEIEIFEGKDNKLSMYQTYTKSFQCQYHLQRYPFDIQVSNI